MNIRKQNTKIKTLFIKVIFHGLEVTQNFNQNFIILIPFLLILK